MIESRCSPGAGSRWGAPSEHPTIEFAVRMRGDSLPPLEDCMVALPWLAGPQDRNELDDSVVMASRFELASPRHVPQFLVASLRIHSQVRRSDGAIGVALIARPLRREFYTLSAWRDRDAIDAMVSTEPHRSMMKAFRKHTADAEFTFWTTSSSIRPSWTDAHSRLGRRRGRR